MMSVVDVGSSNGNFLHGIIYHVGSSVGSRGRFIVTYYNL